MNVKEFEERIDGKRREFVKRSAMPRWGIMAKSKVYKYTPMDECPNCSRYKYQAIEIVEEHTLRSNVVVNGFRCDECELREFIEDE
ncbi:hypothetical protein HUG10_11695 [Halorarum halophilum]|uniref:Uncharacterized protein n=1 Tax=Halorarum halophilum TaxID=2743090 RepID=A0A7D5GIH6_9EURY|nr:hypothetical protein [Halobaculum halophilum]QLG28171.1 hypothetical protein HUG10_11695 [Halobaculum halophilum]